MSSIPSEVEIYAGEVTEHLEEVLGPDLVGVYLHGSAVLGDFAEGRSDVDVIAVSARPLSSKEKEAIAARLSQRSLPCPATGLESTSCAWKTSFNPTLLRSSSTWQRPPMSARPSR